MPAGRPTKYKKRYCKDVVAFCAQGLTLTSFAVSIGVSRSSVYLWADEHDEFSDAIKDAKHACEAFYDQLLLDYAMGKGQGSLGAVIFRLKAKHHWREESEPEATDESYQRPESLKA